MIFAAQEAVEKHEVPTCEQLMTLMDSLHELELRMPEFVWFSTTFEDVRSMINQALESAKDNGDQR
jgi:fructose-bisphosphate aldolase class 1